MVLDLTRLFESEEDEIAFQTNVDLSGYEQSGRYPLKKPVSITGKAQSEAGIVKVRYKALYEVDTLCDRCLEPVRQKRVLEREQVAVRSLEGEDEEEFLLLPDGRLNLSEQVYSDIVLDLPSKILCRAQCKGLCPVCGVNRNETACACEMAAGDPRLQKLRDLLQ